MYVVSEKETGYSDESMRFATKEEVQEYIANQSIDYEFTIRYED